MEVFVKFNSNKVESIRWEMFAKSFIELTEFFEDTSLQIPIFRGYISCLLTSPIEETVIVSRPIIKDGKCLYE